MLMLAPVAPVMGILALIGFYILTKKHGEEPPARTKDSSEDNNDWEPYNRFASSTDVNDFVNGPYSR